MKSFWHITVWAALLSLLVAIFGLPVSMHMEDRMSHHGSTMMVGCPLMMDMDTLCMMDVLDHIALWQQFFLGVLVSTIIFFAVMSSRRAAVLFLSGTGSIGPPDTDALPACFDFHVLFLRRGIMHPRLYA